MAKLSNSPDVETVTLKRGIGGGHKVGEEEKG